MQVLDVRARRLGVVLVVMLALAGAGAGDAATGTTFRSTQYHYSLTLPGHAGSWRVTAAVVRWTVLDLEGLDSPAFDDLAQSQRGWNVAVAARTMRAGTTLRSWTTTVVGLTPGGCERPRTVASTTLGNVSARIFRHTCSDGFDVTKVTAMHRGQGYIVLFASNAANTAASDRRVFEALRRSFRFTS